MELFIPGLCVKKSSVPLSLIAGNLCPWTERTRERKDNRCAWSSTTGSSLPTVYPGYRKTSSCQQRTRRRRNQNTSSSSAKIRSAKPKISSLSFSRGKALRKRKLATRASLYKELANSFAGFQIGCCDFQACRRSKPVDIQWTVLSRHSAKLMFLCRPSVTDMCDKTAREKGLFWARRFLCFSTPKSCLLNLPLIWLQSFWTFSTRIFLSELAVCLRNLCVTNFACLWNLKCFPNYSCSWWGLGSLNTAFPGHSIKQLCNICDNAAQEQSMFGCLFCELSCVLGAAVFNGKLFAVISRNFFPCACHSVCVCVCQNCVSGSPARQRTSVFLKCSPRFWWSWCSPDTAWLKGMFRDLFWKKTCPVVPGEAEHFHTQYIPECTWKWVNLAILSTRAAVSGGAGVRRAAPERREHLRAAAAGDGGGGRACAGRDAGRAGRHPHRRRPWHVGQGAHAPHGRSV